MDNISSNVAKRYGHVVFQDNQPGAIAFCKDAKVANLMALVCNLVDNSEASNSAVKEVAKKASNEFISSLPADKSVNKTEVLESFECSLTALLKYIAVQPTPALN